MSQQAPRPPVQPDSRDSDCPPERQVSAPAVPTPQDSSNDPLLFARPAPGEKPIGFLRLMVIMLSSHIGVRSRANREEDFRRANGLHVFIAGFVYFGIVVSLLILLVNTIAGS